MGGTYLLLVLSPEQLQLGFLLQQLLQILLGREGRGPLGARQLLLLLLLLCGQETSGESLGRSARPREALLRPPAQVRLSVVEGGAGGTARRGAGRSAAAVEAACAPPREHVRRGAGAQQVTCNPWAICILAINPSITKLSIINLPNHSIYQSNFQHIYTPTNQ